MQLIWLFFCSLNTGFLFNNLHAGLAVWFAGLFFMWSQK
jgi:hypothetical protein